MASLKTISAALKLVDVKKEDLRKAFEDLQAHSSSLASFTLQWKDLEDHFGSIQKSLEERFKELESKDSQSVNGSAQLTSLPEKKQSPDKQSLSVSVAVKKIAESAVSPRPELKSLCVKMDGKGLRSYVMEHRKDLNSMRDELAVAFLSASDPAKLVLDAMQGFYPPNSKGDKDGELAATRRTCILLLEQLMKISTQIKPQVKENSKKLAVEWKGKISTDGESPLEALAFLQLLATYGLVSAFNTDEVLDLVASVVRRRQSIDLCRLLGFTEKMPGSFLLMEPAIFVFLVTDFIQKLISKGKHLDAVRFVYAFELAEKFPPVPLLKAYVKDSKKVAQEIRKKGNNSLQSQNEATAKEIAALKAVIKYVGDHKLESQYPRENLEKRVEQLEKQKADRKRPAAAPATKPQQHQPGNKRPRQAAPPPASKPVACGTSTAPLIQRANLQPSGLLPNQVSPYLSSSAGPYGLAGSNPSVAPYMNSSAGLYGLSGTPMGFAGNLSPTRSHLYSSESLTTPGYYDRSTTYGGYGLPPQYRPSYYP
ncbi:hypothetical protein HHK36_003371 [Tetracentron sinense]|uniref:FRIGIDA-like protein n=1 Tax=Tetracentron sinense TaxID=13715 RepID=A0A834ZN31_TETSI|nr:hypothetical protein HHK36_003371 [Tetracentron sinense]